MDIKNKKILIWAESILTKGDITAVSALTRELSSKGCDVAYVCDERTKNKILACQTQAKNYLLPNIHVVENEAHDSPYDVKGCCELTDNNLSYEMDVAFQQNRLQALKEAYSDYKPDILLTSHWPMGRRKFDAELVPFIEHIRKTDNQNGIHTDIVSLARDIPLISHGTEGRIYNATRVLDLIDRYFDSVLIRGDRSLLDTLSFIPDAERIRSKCEFVGYPITSKDSIIYREAGDVVVMSTHTSPSARDFIKAAMDAKESTNEALKNKLWNFYIQPELIPEIENYKKIKINSESIHIHSISPKEYHEASSKAGLAICASGLGLVESYAKYGIPTVTVPNIKYEDDLNRNEQYIRAIAIERNAKGKVVVILRDNKTLGEFSGEIAEAANRAYANRHKDNYQIKLNGSVEGANLLLGKELSGCLMPRATSYSK